MSAPEFTQGDVAFIVAGLLVIFWCIGFGMGWAGGYARGLERGLERGMQSMNSAWSRGKHGPQGPLG